MDLLRVDVVKFINDTFASVGREVMTVDELVEAVKDDPEIWALYENGFTMGLNQCEREKTTQRVKQFKPKNTVELSAFIAAIRPGAKSLVDGFVARQFHNYGIPAMDDLLKLDGATGVTGTSSFLFYDEQVMTLAKSAGISPADANALIKHIKKKHLPEVASYKERFIPGFIEYLQQKQGTEEALAKKTAEDVWTVILNSASYLFNASHAYAMCLDSLYGAYLKRHYPYEFYTVLLKLYTDKGNKEKVALIIDEMRRYKNILLRPGQFGQDNRGWYIDKEKHSISQSLSSIKFVSKAAAEDLYQIGKESFDSFTALLYRLLIGESALNTRQVRVLISVGYFQHFGGNGKLMKIFEAFTEGKNKIYKSLSEKSKLKRLEENILAEQSMEDSMLPLEERVRCENEYIGLCFSSERTAPANLFFVSELDDQYGVKAKLYSVQRGTSGMVKLRKQSFAALPFKAGDCIWLDQGGMKPRYSYKGDKRTPIPGEQDYWMTKYHIAT